jgi:hypothetical protein
MELNFAKKLPEAWRLLRISLTGRRIAGAATISLVICLLLSSYTGLYGYLKSDVALEPILKHLCALMLGYLGLLWCIVLPGQISFSLSQEFAIGTWLFQQTTPQSVRKLLLGKMLGAGGEVYVASAVALPFLIVSAIGGSYNILDVAAVCLFILVFSAFLSSFVLYFASVAGKRGSSAIVISIVLFFIFLFSSTVMRAAMQSPGSAAGLYPFFVAGAQLGTFNLPSTFIYFFDSQLPLMPFALVFYLVWGGWLFVAAESQVRRSMTIPMSRLPLLAAFALLEFYIIGFTRNGSFKDGKWYETAVYIYNSFSLLFLYYVILNQARPLADIRPWLYHLRERGRKWPDLFRGDAPAVFTIVALLLIVAIGAVALPGLPPYPEFTFKNVSMHVSVEFMLLVQLSLVLVIIIRDALFFSAGQLMFKRGKEIAMLIYIIAFGALPGLLLMRKESTPVLDLSFISALVSPIIATDWDHRQLLFALYLGVNGLLAIVFAAVNWRILKKAQTSLPADLIK